jgi:tetratricopeptide (TPR) repeat protein
MLSATIFEDLQRIQWLFIALIVAVGVWYFRGEIKDVMKRLSKLEARRKDTAISATLENVTPEAATDGTTSPPAAEDRGTATEEAATGGADSSDEPEDVEAIRGAMIRAYIAGDKAKGDELFNQLGSLETSPAERRRDQVRQLATEVVGGINSNGLDSLERLADTDDDPSFVYRMIGLCLDATEKPAESAAVKLKAAETAKTVADRVMATTARVASLIEIGEGDAAISEALGLLDKVDDRKSKVELFEALGDAYKSCGDLELSGLAFYQAALLAGNNASNWFRAGYTLSQSSNEALTVLIVHCYLTALSFKADHSTAKNNLAVALHRSDLRITANRYYREAADLGNSLAAANIAGNYLGAGFADEASELLKDAAEKPNPADKVAQVTADIATNSRREREKMKALKDAGSRVGHMMSAYFEALRAQSPPSIAEDWKAEGKPAKAELDGQQFVVSWSTGEVLGGRRISGRLEGRGLSGSLEKERFALTGDGEAWQNSGRAYGVISQSGHVIDFVLLPEGEPEYVTMVAAVDDSSV